MRYNSGEYDVIVVGAGHAGCEAGLASARMGLKTLVCTLNLDAIGLMPCNPNIGGTAKGHLVREVDALGGEMGINIDHTFIQSRMLNTSKGPAVHSLRAQADRKKYQNRMKNVLENQENLEVRQLEVIDIEVEDGKVVGVLTKNGAFFKCKAIVLTTGTYLRARIIIGDVTYNSGPNGLAAANELTQRLMDLGIEMRRFKTGTPARINKRSVDFSKMIEQPGDKKIVPFSFMHDNIEREQVSCWLTYTNEETHNIIKENLGRSPLYNGSIEGVGPRYCPSIEDKIVRFSDKERHQLFLEPESIYYDDIYIQGFSTSMPYDVQDKMIRSLPGLENAKVNKYAYAIEYDAIDSMQLKPSLETKIIEGLYTAGQINGTSGYEEAAGQGLIAGINAALKLSNKEPLILKRNESYIGVLIDDLITKGVIDPYRLLTSRAEYRLLLRHDNADLRLSKYGHDIGLISDEKYKIVTDKIENINRLVETLKTIKVTPTKEVNEYLESLNSAKIYDGIYLYDLLKRPEISLKDLKKYIQKDYSHQVEEQVEIIAKYEGYILKAEKEAEKMLELEKISIPKDIDYSKFTNIAKEAREKLDKIKPISIGQAIRISGVNPSDISMLMMYLKRGTKDE